MPARRSVVVLFLKRVSFRAVRRARCRGRSWTKVSKSGYSVAVYPTKTSNMPVYYPAFVVYGHRGPGTETADQARKHKARGGVKVAAPRKNFIPEAAQEKSKALQDQIFDALGDAIK